MTTRQVGGISGFAAGSKVRIVFGRNRETRRTHVLHPALAAAAPRIAINCHRGSAAALPACGTIKAEAEASRESNVVGDS